MGKVVFELREGWRGQAGWVRVLQEGIPGRWNSKCKNSEVGKGLRGVAVAVTKADCRNNAGQKAEGLQNGAHQVNAFGFQLGETPFRVALPRGGHYQTARIQRFGSPRVSSFRASVPGGPHPKISA